MTDADRPRVGISACLLGQKVRYDGEHKRADLLVEELGPLVQWVPVCPELEVGMGVPREPVELVRGGAGGRGLRMLGVTSREDWTERMNDHCSRRLAELPALAGYVLKSRSPSCGLAGVNVRDPASGGPPRAEGVGLFARALRERFPELPIAEESALGDALALRGFLELVLDHHLKSVR